MSARGWTFAAIATLSLAANVLLGCTHRLVKTTCGDWHLRAVDHATCRECRDAQGSYAECGVTVDRRK